MRGAVLFSLAVLSVAACSFPDVTYAPPDSSTADDHTVDAPVADAPVVDAPEDGGGEDVTVDVTEDRVADVISDYVFEAPPDANPCDKDGDGHLDKNNAACGGKADDCCDTDPRVYPGEPTYYPAAYDCKETSSVSFDYNCDGTNEAEYNTNVNCSSLLGIGCSGYGFLGNDPGCGYSGPFGSCSPGVASCNQMLAQQPYPTQGCR